MSSHHHLNSSSGEINHIHVLSEDMGSVYLSEEYADVTIVVAGQKFRSHKLILAARSEYFRALLFGGMKESMQSEIELNASSLPAFKGLLKYIYTGRMSLTNERDEVILDILALAHLYGFMDLEAAISDYLREILSIKNVCSILDTAFLYHLEFLTNVCFEYMDIHASEVIQHESFQQLSSSALTELISRDSFCAPETEIFSGVRSWVNANPDVNPIQVLAQLRLSLIPLSDLLSTVRSSQLVSADALLDAIDVQTHTPDSKLPYRGHLLIDENVAHPSHGAQVLQGEMRSFLLNGDTHNYDMERGYTRHTISDTEEHGILIKLGSQYIINHIKMLLWDLDLRSYSYYIEGSMNQKDWVMLVNHKHYSCRSWQFLYFEPRVVLYIRIVGTNNTVNKVFHVVNFEAYYMNHTVKLSQGLIVPTKNIATTERSACVIEGVSRSRNNLLNGDTSTYDWDSGYTCHQLGSKSILVQLSQPYMIESMRLLLWDCDNRSYSYYIEVSGNAWSWVLVADKTKKACRSWQTIHFYPPRPVVFIKIVGTHNTANEVFHCVHFECPAPVDDKSSKSPTQEGQTSLDDMKPGAKKSIVWEYYTTNSKDKKIICSICNKQFTYYGNTTNLKKHLERIHPIQFHKNDPPRPEIVEDDPLPEKENDPLRTLEENNPLPSSSVENPSTSNPAAVSQNNAPLKKKASDESNFVSKRPRQLKLFGARCNELSAQDKEEIDGKLIKMITSDYQPLSIVENEGFREYTNKLNPLYTIPSRKHLSVNMLPNLYTESISELKKKLDSVWNVAITTDIWTSDSAKGYITVTSHFIHNDKMCAYVLATKEICGSHTAENIGNVLTTILNEWQIFNKVVTIVSDNGANIKKSISEHLRKYHHPCVAHTLNLSVTEAISSNYKIPEILKKCRNLVGHFKHSALSTEKLKNIQLQMGFPILKVKQDVATRWNSSLIMMERLLQIKDALSMVITNLPKAPEFLDAHEWMILKDCVPILKPVEILTTVLSGEKYPTISLVIPLIRGLQHTLKNIQTETSCGEILKTSLSEIVNRRLGCLEQNKIVAKATFLDPRFKKIGFGLEENANNTQKWISDELTYLINKKNSSSTLTTSELEPTTSTSQNAENIWAHFDNKIAQVKSYTTPTTTAILAIRQYLELPLIERSKSPLEFWKEHKLMFPELYELATKYLCVPGTSVSSERVFSKTGQLTNDRRNRLSPKNLDMIIFLNAFCQ